MGAITGEPWSTTYKDFMRSPNSGTGMPVLPQFLEDGAGNTTTFRAGKNAAGLGGWLFVDLANTTSATDVVSALAYYDTLANSIGAKTLAITNPGSYYLSHAVFSHAAHVFIGPAVNFTAVSSRTGGFMFDFRRSEFHLDCLGGIFGNRSNTASTMAYSGLHTYQNSKVSFNGYGIGRVSGFTYHGIWMRDADDLSCEGFLADDCQYDPIYFEATTKNTYRWRIANNLVDRRSETGSAGDAGCLKAQNTSPDAFSTVFMHDILFENNVVLAPTSMTNVAFEIWGGAKNVRVVGGAIVGPRRGFSLSLDHVIGGEVSGVDIRSYGVLGIESAGSSNIRIHHNRLTDGAQSGTGIIIDNQTVAGSVFLISDNEIHAGATAAEGIKAKGAASIWPTGIIATNNVVTGTASAFAAFYTDGAAAQIHGGQYRAPNGYPITLDGVGKHRGEIVVKGVFIHGHRPIYVGACSHFNISDNVFSCTGSGTIILADVANGFYGRNVYLGALYQHQIHQNSGYTVNNIDIGPFWGSIDAAAFGVNFILNAGSWGSNIRMGELGTWGPYGVSRARFMTYNTTNILWEDGIYNGNPNGAVEGDAGSTLRDQSNGRWWFKKSGTKTASHWFSVVAS